MEKSTKVIWFLNLYIFYYLHKNYYLFNKIKIKNIDFIIIINQVIKNKKINIIIIILSDSILNKFFNIFLTLKYNLNLIFFSLFRKKYHYIL